MEGVEKDGFLECEDDACGEEEEESCDWDCLGQRGEWTQLLMWMGGLAVATEAV